jgi:hypothetical protein
LEQDTNDNAQTCQSTLLEELTYVFPIIQEEDNDQLQAQLHGSLNNHLHDQLNNQLCEQPERYNYTKTNYFFRS